MSLKVKSIFTECVQVTGPARIRAIQVYDDEVAENLPKWAKNDQEAGPSTCIPSLEERVQASGKGLVSFCRQAVTGRPAAEASA